MTRAQMPSAAQMRVLEALVAGERLEHWQNASTHPVVLRGNGHMTPVRFCTHRALYLAGCIARQEATEGNAPVRHYAITDLGRHALASAKASALLGEGNR